MKTLILTRHAKSSWDDPMLDDHERVLNGRGRRGAEAIGLWLGRLGLLPGEVLVSDAVRTLETWAGVADAAGAQATVRAMPELYHASPQEMLDALRTAKADAVMMIAHNPGIASFAAGMVDEPPAHSRFRDYPTAATCIIEFDIADWSEVERASGRVAEFVMPHDL